MPSTVTRTTLYEQVALKMREDILRDGKPGDKFDSEAKLAERYGVSVRTIREAITSFVHDGIVQRRAGRGTWITEKKVEAKSHIALILGIDWTHPSAAAYSGKVLQLSLEILRAKGANARPYWFVHEAGENHSSLQDEELAKQLKAGAISSFAVIHCIDSLGNLPSGNEVPGIWPIQDKHAEWKVGYDAVEFINRGVKHLARAGCSRIAWIGGVSAPDHSEKQIKGRNYPAFAQAIEKNGCQSQESWIKHGSHPMSNGAAYEKLQEIWASSSKKPDGLLVLDDNFLPDIALAMRDMGVSEKDLKVVTVSSKGSLVLPQLKVERLIIDPSYHAEALCKMLTDLSEGRSPSSKQVSLPIYEME